MRTFKTLALAVTLLASTAALATPLTETSPTGGALPAGVTKVGGIVLDLKGLNGTRVVSQVAASTLFVGSPTSPQNPFLIGTQTGFTSAVLGGLGGGLSSASIRVTVYDGDNRAGDFDFNDNSLLANGVNFGNFSSVLAEETNSIGTVVLSTALGFGDDRLGTGFFTNTNSSDLATFFTSLAGGSVQYRLLDVDPGDQFYDFTQGVDGGLATVGTGPTVVQSAVPEPATWAMMIIGFGIAGASLRQRRATAMLKLA